MSIPQSTSGLQAKFDGSSLENLHVHTRAVHEDIQALLSNPDWRMPPYIKEILQRVVAGTADRGARTAAAAPQNQGSPASVTSSKTTGRTP